MSTEVTNNEQTKPEASVEAAAPKNEGLSLNDLQAVVQIIDAATQRGAFKANELVNVGTVYNKLVSFLAGVKAASEAKDKA